MSQGSIHNSPSGYEYMSPHPGDVQFLTFTHSQGHEEGQAQRGREQNGGQQVDR